MVTRTAVPSLQGAGPTSQSLVSWIAYIHAKAIIADHGTSTARIFLGSENFSSTSLNQNRELGLIISDPTVMSQANATVTSDFANGAAW